MTQRQRRITLGLLLVIAVAITLIMTSAKMPEQTSPKAKIEFYPCNGSQTRSYIAYSLPVVEPSRVEFKAKEGNRIILSGSYSIIIL